MFGGADTRFFDCTIFAFTIDDLNSVSVKIADCGIKAGAIGIPIAGSTTRAPTRIQSGSIALADFKTAGGSEGNVGGPGFCSERRSAEYQGSAFAPTTHPVGS